MPSWTLNVAATFSRLEGQITIPSSTTATVGGGTATITPGTYYPSTLLEEVATQFATAGSTTCDVTAGFGRNGSGLVTIEFGDATAVTWVSTSLRDLLGFSGNLSSATTHVAPRHARNVWIAPCAYQAPNAVDALFRGHRHADVRYAENAGGYVWAFNGPQSKEVCWLKWPAVPRSRTFIANEVYEGESFERFCRDTIWGEAAWGTPAGPVRFYPDADDTVKATYKVVDFKQFMPTPYHPSWVGGPHTIELPRLVVVPGT